MSRFLLVCDHASNAGRPMEHHTAYDIGAAGVTRALAEILDAPAVYSTVSRLIVDCNRHLTVTGPDADSFHAYHDAIEAELVPLGAPVFLSIHSMTPELGGVARPWQIALSSYTDRRLTDPVLAALRAFGDITVGDNEPYDIDPAIDFTTPFHAIRRGLLHLQVEFRQDEVATPEGQLWWARRFALALHEGMAAIH
jgi:predicted N-formylglutamate amidohydrolase